MASSLMALGAATLSLLADAGPARADRALLEAAYLCLTRESDLATAASALEELGFERMDDAGREGLAPEVSLARVTTRWLSSGTDLRRVFDGGLEMAEKELSLAPGAYGKGAVAFSHADGDSRILLRGTLRDDPWGCTILVSDRADLRFLLETAGIELEASGAPGFRSYHAEVSPPPGRTDVMAFSVDREVVARHGIETDLAGGLDVRRD